MRSLAAIPSRELILRIADTLSGQSLFEQLAMLHEEQQSPPQLRRSRQEERLSELLTHASKNTEFYAGRIPSKALAKGLEGLREIPILEKHELIAHSSEMKTSDTNRLVAMRSGGSSGRQSTVWINRRNLGLLRATQIFWWQWADYRFGARSVQIGVTPRDLERWFKDLVFGIDYVFTETLAERSARIIGDIYGETTRHLMGYPSRVLALAREASALRVKGSPGLVSVILFGDKIFEHDKTFVEEVFGAPLYESYGSAEGFLVAAHDGDTRDSLRVMDDHVLVEIVDFEGAPLPIGEFGQIIVTVLDNLTMPLIRYNTGDLGRLTADGSDTAAGGCRLDREICRRSELVGKDLSAPFTVHDLARMIHGAGPVQNFRLKRKADGIVYLQTSSDGLEDQGPIRSIAQFLEGIIHEPVYTDSLADVPRLPSGKPEFIDIAPN